MVIRKQYASSCHRVYSLCIVAPASFLYLMHVVVLRREPTSCECQTNLSLPWTPQTAYRFKDPYKEIIIIKEP